MKTILFHASLTVVLSAPALFSQIPSAGPEAAAATPSTARYAVIDLGTFGGNFSIAYGVNNAGRIAGAAANRSQNQRPFISGVGGTKYDLGTLGGPNAQASAPNGANDVPIISELAVPDPLGQDFCGFGTHLVCRAGLWDGSMRLLPNLGGNNAMAVAMNNRGQLAGVAENAIHDPACQSPQILDFVPTLWGPGPGDVRELPRLPGDTVGFVLSINDLGQAVGSSGTCDNSGVTAVGLFYGPHPVLWDGGAAINLGSLGGKTMGKAGTINNRGEIAGFSSLPGDTETHSFLWTHQAGMQDLGALGKDSLGDPTTINNLTQIVGGSCDDAGNCRAFLWEQKSLMDLNSLIPADSPLYLVYALGINDAGEITGVAVQTATGDLHAYLAAPFTEPLRT